MCLRGECGWLGLSEHGVNGRGEVRGAEGADLLGSPGPL